MLNLVFQLEDVIMEPHNVTPPQELETLPLDFHLRFLSTLGTPLHGSWNLELDSPRLSL